MKVLVINPGATSTKVAVFDEETQVYKTTVDHSPQELDRFDRVIDQADYRKEAILKAVTEAGYKLSDFAAVCGRGGLYRAIPSGTYAVNDKVMADVEAAPYGEHPSNLGAYLARRIGDLVGIPAFFVDPVCVDEMTEVAHVSGFAEFRRLSQFHALNQKAVAKRYAKEIGKPYESLNLIVCHMGGGVSVGAHVKGEVVDTGNALEGEGPFSPERSGTLPSGALVDLCFSGKYTEQEIRRMITGNGGLLAYTGSTDMQELMRRAATDAKVREVIDAFHYRVAKEIGAMAAAMKGQVDQIILTGGIAHGQETVDALKGYVSWIAPVTVYPGEGELLALAEGALRVLRGEETAKIYE